MAEEGRDDCPGCNNTRGGQICCDTCWGRAPRNLPGQPRWRSRRRTIMRHPGRGGYGDWDELEGIDKALVKWLHSNRVIE